MSYRDLPTPPPHVADGRFSTALIGPLVRFRGHQIPVDRTPPRNTVDGDRWRNCTDHHLACDCREAEQNENLNEMRGEMRLIKDVLAQATVGHPTFVEVRQYGSRRRDLECQCIACDLIRRLERTSVHVYDNTVVL